MPFCELYANLHTIVNGLNNFWKIALYTKSRQKSIACSMIFFFFIGWPLAKVAVIAGALLLITRRVKPEKIYHEIKFSLLVLFMGLLIVIAGIEKTPLTSKAFAFVSGYGLEKPSVLSSVAAILSNVSR
jgi:Na+/H+ antiporter NhaD/arsenite permease-like protein